MAHPDNHEQNEITVPEIWRGLQRSKMQGVVLVVGGPDTGKSTFAHWLWDQLVEDGRHAAFLDGDVGQSVLGPPTALTLSLPASNALKADPVPQGLSNLKHWFVGDVSPRGHMLPLVVGAGRLVQHALASAADVIIVDTTGLVDPVQGGVALKHALVDQLQPTMLVALQRDDELEPILTPLRRLCHLCVIELPVTKAVRRRDVAARQAHRAMSFRRYFSAARVKGVALRGRAVFEGQTFARCRLLALQDEAGFTLALGVIERYIDSSQELFVRTPWPALNTVASIRLGAIGVDVATGREFRPGRTT